MRTFRFDSLRIAAICLASVVLIHANRSDANQQNSDIVQTAVTAGQFNTLVQAVKTAGLVDALKGAGPFTVFAPTDAAFARLPKGAVESLLKPENRQLLTAVLTYHVVPARVTAAQVVNLTTAGTLNGQRLAVSTSDGVRINDARVVSPDIMCSNGIIHVVDTVLMPNAMNLVETARDAGMFKTLLAALDAAGLSQVLQGDGPFTVLAPTDDAFGQLPAGTVESLLEPGARNKLVQILKYHVIPGRVYSQEALAASTVETLQGDRVRFALANGRLSINGAGVVANDIGTANGVAYIIDKVLMPPTSGTTTSAAAVTQLIDLAISRGAPLFNAGQIDACAAIYEVTVTSLLTLSPDLLDTESRTRLKDALSKAARMHDASDQAWAFRYALDAVYAASTADSGTSMRSR